VTCQFISLSGITALQTFPSNTFLLILNSNGIESINEGFFASNNLGGLRELELIDNPLRAISQSSFSGLPSLTFLTIEGSLLTSLPDDLLFQVRGLTGLDLKRNELLQSVPDSILIGLDTFRRFRLQNSKLVTEIPQRLFLTVAYTLEDAYFVGNGLTSDGIPTDVFHGAPVLQYIYFINENGISDIRSSWFQNLPFVREVFFINCNSLQTIQPGAFDGLSPGALLDLSGNDLSDEGIPDDLFVNIAPVHAYLACNPRLTEFPAACEVGNGVTCAITGNCF